MAVLPAMTADVVDATLAASKALLFCAVLLERHGVGILTTIVSSKFCSSSSLDNKLTTFEAMFATVQVRNSNPMNKMNIIVACSL